MALPANIFSSLGIREQPVYANPGANPASLHSRFCIILLKSAFEKKRGIAQWNGVNFLVAHSPEA
jgi:hypothetical protein